jgi:hypothetical protein
LDPARVTSSPGWRKVFAREVGAVSEPDEEEPGALATLGDAPLSVPDSSLLGEVPHEPSDTLQPTLPTARRERLETEAGALAGTEPSERTFSFTCVAGLAFLLGPLRDLGIQAALHAIRNEPSLVLYDVLRAVLTRLEVECPAEDPAPWLLAGLFAAPSPDDLSDDVALWSVEECAALGRACGRECRDYREACDAWAEVVLEDIDARLTALSLGTDLVVPSAKDLMVLHGTFCSEPERLSVVLPFPASYEALLRAGLLADLRDVPWLGGRSLLFVFEESA